MVENTNKSINLAGTIKFKCPNCGKAEIVRSQKERIRAIKYKCSECGFEGPN